ncbi:peptide/nickel transport system substrate-binding protein [Anaerobacterium chartisolvens]|uniref:Peptide/nickel transport system substrate-binding protein n=1 Tax=Anaerobacterium chartisolvens TaxID=1297424 RepID=A0A369B6Q8_9FIRM|nr:peptide ABC transporter substrate-binding protein [Anaerobacterium chartisolvens]RCX17121.1 peptide/nickel transport system substrate-binding protein [Anaerobacterium chartisolvens]
MRKLCFFTALIIMLLSLSSCSEADNSGGMGTQDSGTALAAEANDNVVDKGPVKGGVVNLFTTKPDSLNPILTKNIFVQNFTGFIFDGMVRLDENQRPTPALCDTWSVSDDGLIWTFHVRENAMWHNNVSLTAEDIKFTFDVIQNSRSESVYRDNISNIAVYTAVDRNSFRIFLKAPDYFIPERMTFPIVPAGYYQGEDVFVKTSDKNMLPVGTGPYKFIKSQRTDGYRLISNDLWWGLREDKNSGLQIPYINEIDINIYDSPKDEFVAFQEGNIDIAVADRGDFSKYSGRPDITTRKYQSRDFEFIAFNLDNPALKDKAVRQAIALATDKARIINDVIPGQAVAAELPVNPNAWIFDNPVSYLPDKSKARDILMQNGWKQSAAGMYKSIDGKRVTLNFTIIVNEFNEIRYRAAVKLGEQLREAGINIEVKRIDWDEEFRLIKSRKFDMVFLGCRISSVPDISFMYASLQTGGMNIANYKNPLVDACLERIITNGDEKVRREAFNEMHKVLSDEIPYMGMYFYNNAVLYNRKIRGDMKPCVWDRFNDITRWYIPG